MFLCYQLRNCTLAFRANRLCDTFPTFGGGQLASPTFAHALDPQWPLCAFEHAPRGACHDAACAAQMTVDYGLPPKLALDNVVKLAARSDADALLHTTATSVLRVHAHVRRMLSKVRCSNTALLLMKICTALSWCMLHCHRAGGTYKPPVKVEAAQLQQLAEAAVTDRGVQRRMLLSPSKHAPPRRARAVLAPARQATLDAPVPAYVRSTLALADAAAAEASPLPAQPHAAISTEPGPSGRSPFYAAPAGALANVSPAEPTAEHHRKPASARVGRYFGSAQPDAADPAQAAAPHAGGSASGQRPDDFFPWLVQHSGLPAVRHGDGGGDDDTTVARLRVGISRGGNDGLLCWRLLVELLARRAAAMPSPGATAPVLHSSQVCQHSEFAGKLNFFFSYCITSLADIRWYKTMPLVY